MTCFLLLYNNAQPLLLLFSRGLVFGGGWRTKKSKGRSETCTITLMAGLLPKKEKKEKLFPRLFWAHTSIIIIIGRSSFCARSPSMWAVWVNGAFCFWWKGRQRRIKGPRICCERINKLELKARMTRLFICFFFRFLSCLCVCRRLADTHFVGCELFLFLLSFAGMKSSFFLLLFPIAIVRIIKA